MSPENIWGGSYPQASSIDLLGAPPRSARGSPQICLGLPPQITPCQISSHPPNLPGLIGLRSCPPPPLTCSCLLCENHQLPQLRAFVPAGPRARNSLSASSLPAPSPFLPRRHHQSGPRPCLTAAPPTPCHYPSLSPNCLPFLLTTSFIRSLTHSRLASHTRIPS